MKIIAILFGIVLLFPVGTAYGTHSILIETLIICALTTVPPYYDCSENWTIYLYDEIPRGQCADYSTKSCAILSTKRIYMSINQPESYDECGYTTLWHALNHLKYLDESYCH